MITKAFRGRWWTLCLLCSRRKKRGGQKTFKVNGDITWADISLSSLNLLSALAVCVLGAMKRLLTGFLVLMFDLMYQYSSACTGYNELKIIELLSVTLFNFNCSWDDSGSSLLSLQSVLTWSCGMTLVKISKVSKYHSEEYFYQQNSADVCLCKLHPQYSCGFLSLSSF